MNTFDEVKKEFFLALKGVDKANNAATPQGGTTQATFAPINQPSPQIYTAQEAVRSLSNHLQHPCSINHDASTTGVRHASMTVHPEWNQEHVKEQADSHLVSSGFKGKKADGYTGKTYEHPQTGAKVHVATIGKHLVITSDDKKGTKGTPYVANPDASGDKKGKK